MQFLLHTREQSPPKPRTPKTHAPPNRVTLRITSASGVGIEGADGVMTVWWVGARARLPTYDPGVDSPAAKSCADAIAAGMRAGEARCEGRAR